MDGSFYAASLLGRLDQHASQFSDEIIYTFIPDQGDTETLTFGQLAKRVRSIASQLRDRFRPGERAVLMYPQGLEFICSYLGCLAAGMVAVPAYPLRRNRNADRINGIIADCTPSVLLTIESIQASFPHDFAAPAVIATEKWATTEAMPWEHALIRPDTVAFLQYTSGSTGNPKGVVVTHGNIACNEKQIEINTGNVGLSGNNPSVMISWLPLFHDMGLIGGVLQPLYVGFPSVLMAPTTFSKEPLRWLRAISDYKGTMAGAPNFAYDYCARTVTKEQLIGIDLSSLRVLFNAAEPVRAETLDRFAKTFAPVGFKKQMFFPCYGMAEATLFVSGGPHGKEPRQAYLDGPSLEAGSIKAVDARAPGAKCVIGCGVSAPGLEIRIVDPETRTCSPGNRVGEIWIKSECVAPGYWGCAEDASKAFKSCLADTGEGPFFATGDLGFFIEPGELCVTGRMKDLIIIRGRNIYPQDIEAVVSNEVAFIANGCSAFGVNIGNEERVVLVAEASRGMVRSARSTSNKNELDDIVDRVRKAIGESFEVPVHAMVFVRPGSFPRTSSGKVQRRTCRDRFLAGTLDLVHAWTSNSEKEPANSPTSEALLEEVSRPIPAPMVTPMNSPAVVKSKAPMATTLPLDSLQKYSVKNDHLRKRQRGHALLIALGPIIGMAALIVIVWGTWITPLDLALLVAMYAITFVGISVGFHRLFTHNAFKAHPLTRFVLAAAGSMAAEAPVIYWVATHRRHHQYSDREGDPHSPNLHGETLVGRLRGLWYGHAGWMYYHETTNTATYAKDLLQDSVIRNLNRGYPLLVLLGLAIPAGVGGLVTLSWIGAGQALFWGGFARMFLVHHFTWSINSICHAFGHRDHATGDYSANNPWLALATFGESWHNNHHDAPSAASFSRKWWQVDLGAMVVRGLELTGLAWDVKRVRATQTLTIESRDRSTTAIQVASKSTLASAARTRKEVTRRPSPLHEKVDTAFLGWLRAEVDPSLERIDPDKPFTSLGVDSVGAAKIISEIEKATGVNLNPEIVYEYSTINRLVKHIEDRMPYESRTITTPENQGSLTSEILSPIQVNEPSLKDPLCGSLADYTLRLGRRLKERAAPYKVWRESRLDAGVWPFNRLAKSPAAPSTSVSDGQGNHRSYLNFASQDYLGLARDPRVLLKAQEAIAEFGIHSAGSPALLGTTTAMADLERLLAETLAKEDCMVYATGWAAGFGVVTGLVGKHDTLVLDSLCHKCLLEGARHVAREPLLYRHNDLDHLREILQQARQVNTTNGLFVVAESLYSMDSDSPNLPELIRVVREFEGILILDVAHDLGSTGVRGLGLLEELEGSGLSVDVVMGSFSKTFSSTGGFVSADKDVVDYLRSFATPYVFSNAISPVQAAAVLECSRIAFSEEGIRLRELLMSNVNRLRFAMRKAGFRVGGTPSPIVPVFVGEERVARLMARQIARNGLLANLVEFPAVAIGEARFRFQVMSTHTPKMAEEAAEIFARSHQEVIRA